MKSILINSIATFTALIVLTTLFIPLLVFAQGQTYQPFYQPMVEIPGVTDITAQNGGAVLSEYVNALYALAIVIAGMIAVIKLVIAGAKYMMSDSFTSKGQAIEDIKGALLGILIILTAFLILATINPRLTGVDFLPDGGVAVDPSEGMSDYFDLSGYSCPQGDPTCRVIQCTDFLDSSCQAACSALNGIYYDPNDLADAAGLAENSCTVIDSLIPRGEPMEDYPGWEYCPEVTYNSWSFAVAARQSCENWCRAVGGEPWFNNFNIFAGRYRNQCNVNAQDGVQPPVSDGAAGSNTDPAIVSGGDLSIPISP